MYKVIKVEDDIVYVVNLENNKPMKLNKSKIDWDIKVNDYIEFYFIDDKVIVTKVEKEDNIKTLTSLQNDKISVKKEELHQPKYENYSNINSYQPNNQTTQISNDMTMPMFFGIMMSLVLNVMGLVIGLITYNEQPTQRKVFLKSWLFTRIVLEVIRIILICIFWKEVFYGLLFNSTI